MNTGATPTILIAGAVKIGNIYFIISTKNCFGLALFRKTQIKTSLDGGGGGKSAYIVA